MSNATGLPLDNNPAASVNSGMSKEAFYAVAWTATCLPLPFLLFRLAIRIRSFKTLFVDDALVIAAWLMLLVSTILWHTKAGTLFWQFRIVTGKAPQSPEFISQWSRLSSNIVVWNILCHTSLWAVKYSCLVFFRRILGPQAPRAKKIWCWVVGILLLAGWVSCVAMIDYKCSANDIKYIMAHCAGRSHVEYQFRTFYGNLAADIVTDLLVMSIPLWMLWHVRIQWPKKLFLAGVFSVTVFVMIAAGIRVALVRTSTTGVKHTSIDLLFIWSEVEMGVAVIVANLASFRQLFVFSRNRNPSGGKEYDATSNRNHQFRPFESSNPSLQGRNRSENGLIGLTDFQAPQIYSPSQHNTTPPDSVYVSHAIKVSSHEWTPEVQDSRRCHNFV
ncbi:hypothetical protein MGU_00260 [Metarhizium guizhouense ARSEF 977]|uniref:Rhodopsin domain-containing protein n=1 Tax=Metarhizium guizhouense (strain ARSEF 977) TaxID=1276136 RepID=A0A0B4HR96_METGA|nr:hypothetical protein MGU_00260 [Metarhizium guizhouense ARSEF 977]